MSPPPHLASVVIDRHTHMNTEVSSHVAYDAHKYPAEAAAHYSNTAEIRTAKKKHLVISCHKKTATTLPCDACLRLDARPEIFSNILPS